MSDRVDTKLRETKYFFQRLVCESEKAVTNEPEAFLYYLNAFLVAGESVRYLLEGKGYDWRKWGTEEERRFLTFMNEQRGLVVHYQGGAEMEVDWVFIPFVELRDQPSHPAFGFHSFTPPLRLRAEPKGQMRDRTEHIGHGSVGRELISSRSMTITRA